MYEGVIHTNAAAHAAPVVRRESATLFRTLCWVQGLYYLVTGVWPIVSIETFQQVTGRKTDQLPTGLEMDHWLVMTVAALVVAVAVTLLFSAWRRRQVAETVILATCSAIALTTIDVFYVSRGTIPRIYLADAAVEVLLIIGWLVAATRMRSEAIPR